MMAQDLRFFDRLYQGFEAEYLVTSALFGAGLEAFKLPGDYGFDLLVSDQWRSTRSRTVAEPLCDTRMPFPYVLQVKSRRAQLSDIRLVEGVERRELEMKFSLKQHEYDLLVADERSFLVCVLFMPPDQRTVSVRPLTFWLTGAQLRNMHEREYLIASIDDRGQPWLTLNVVYRFVPMIRRRLLLSSCLKHGIRSKLMCRRIARCKTRTTRVSPHFVRAWPGCCRTLWKVGGLALNTLLFAVGNGTRRRADSARS